jgi:hypothetical protein
VVNASLMRATIHLVSKRDYWPLAVAIREPLREWWLRVRRPRPSRTALERLAANVHAALADGPRTHRELVELVGDWTQAGPFLALVRVPPSGTWERRRADLFQTADRWRRYESGRIETAASASLDRGSRRDVAEEEERLAAWHS